MNRETKDKMYLDLAQHIADFYLKYPNLPADKIPYWDFNAPNILDEERDTSATAITATALTATALPELCTYGGPSAKTYYESAVKMLESLSSPAYKASLGENNNFILKHSIGHQPQKREVDTPISYADYYYLETLLRYDALRKKATFRSSLIGTRKKGAGSRPVPFFLVPAERLNGNNSRCRLIKVK